MEEASPLAQRCYARALRSEEHTSELQSPYDLVCRLLLEKKNKDEYSILAYAGVNFGSFIACVHESPSVRKRPKSRVLRKHKLRFRIPLAAAARDYSRAV